jgi:hypothetical protein
MLTIDYHRKFLTFFVGIILFGIRAGFAQDSSYLDSTFTEYFRLTHGGWTAGDGTISVPLPDNRVLWLFGDSYIVDVDTANNTLPCLFQVRNCMMVQDSVDLSQFRTIIDSTQSGVNRSTFKIRPDDSTLLWPGHGYVWSDTVYLFMERYSNSDMGKYYGEYIAKLHYPDLHLAEIVPVQMNTNYYFGRAVVKDTVAGWLYIYGNRLNWIVWEPILARCPINGIQGPWQYFTGTGWSSLPGGSQKICDDPVSPGFSVFIKNNKYYLITQENGYLTCGLGREIYSYESDLPQGPFINKKLLYTEESMWNGRYLLTYNAQAHPFFTSGDELLIGYNVNDRVDTTSSNPCPSQCVNIWTDRMDADSYRPKFVRVPFGIITGTKKNETDRNSFRLFPNPVAAGSTFSVTGTNASDPIEEIHITDVSGREMPPFSFKPVTPTLTRVTAQEGPGVYFLTILTKNNIRMVFKLIIVEH